MKMLKTILILSMTYLSSSCGVITKTEVKEVEKRVEVPVPGERKFNRCGKFTDRYCTSDEIAFIKDIEYLSTKIQNIAKQSSLSSHFVNHKTSRGEYSKKFTFLGEEHTDIQLQLDNFAIIERDIAANDVILLEGYTSGLAKECSYAVLEWLHCTLEYSRKGDAYVPGEMASFCAPNWAQWEAVKKELELGSLKMKGAQCRGWDKTSYRLQDVDRLRDRNSSLVETMRSHDRGSKKVFVVAGFRHSPIGEHHQLAHDYLLANNSLQTLLTGDQTKIKYWEHRSMERLYKFPDFVNQVSTEEIYKYLYSKPAEFFSHKRLIKDEKFLPRYFPH